MEYAFVVDRKIDLNAIPSNFTRLYIGAEFCENKLPCHEYLHEILEYAIKKNKKISFITPPVTNKGIDKIKKIIAIIDNYIGNYEIIFNDFGVYNYAKNKKNISLVFGRLLNKAKRDPRILLFESIPDVFKVICSNNNQVQKFFIENSICRVELDNINYIIENINSTKVKISVHYPFIFISTTRLCRNHEDNLYNPFHMLTIPSKCDRNCEKYIVKIFNDEIAKDMYVAGNTQFYYQGAYNEAFYKQYNVDRLVFNSIHSG